MKVMPMGDYVLVALEREVKTAGGIIIPEGADQPRIGKVIVCGPGRFKNYPDKEGGTGREPMDVVEDDRIILGKFAGESYTVRGTTFYLVRQSEIRAVIKYDDDEAEASTEEVADGYSHEGTLAGGQ